jgi:hypothetical protein
LERISCPVEDGFAIGALVEMKLHASPEFWSDITVNEIGDRPPHFRAAYFYNSGLLRLVHHRLITKV